MTRPLDGLIVVSLEHAVAAPFASRQLADMGARVIKIERPIDGDFARRYDDRVNGMSSHFIWVNRSKESLTLDLKNSEAMEVLHELIGRADIFLQNLAPGASTRMGLSYQQLHALYPQLIVCDISGYGLDGPYRNKKAYDLMIQSEAGFLSITGTPQTYCKAGNSIADIAAGMYAYSNILSALLLRQKTGQGSHIDVSMLEALGEWMGFPMYYAYEGAPPPYRSGAAHATIYPYGPFKTGDGKSVMMGIQNEREWNVFCVNILVRPELTHDERFNTNSKRHEHRQELELIILDIFASQTATEVAHRLDIAQIANSQVNEVGEIWSHPQLLARERFSQVNTPSGKVTAMKPPGVNNAFTPRMDPVPEVGEHTDKLLAELGWNPMEIEALKAQHAV